MARQASPFRVALLSLYLAVVALIIVLLIRGVVNGLSASR